MILFNSAQTNTGRVRTENQDYFGVKQESDFFFVCDGMGGGIAGDFASKKAVDVALAMYDVITKKDILDIIGQEYSSFDENVIRPIALIKLANRELNNLTKKYPKLRGMGTTCSAVWFDRNTNLIHIYNVGDSRVYRVRNGKIQQLTEDHSKIQELIGLGKMKEEDIKTAEIQSMITRALGIGETVRVDYKSEIVKPGDLYILCTDGLNGEITDYTINDIANMYKMDVDSVSRELILAANNAGGRDNTTVISIYAQENIDYSSGATAIPTEDIITVEDETKSSSSKEDSLLKKNSKKFLVPVPKLATKKNLFKNPIFIALLLVLIGIGVMFVFNGPREEDEQKSITELTGNVSGINLDIRTLNNDKLEELINTKDRVFKMQVLQEALRNSETFTIPLSNVTVSLSFEGQNKFMGLSSFQPLEIKLPRGKYQLNLEYSDYRILNEQYQLSDAIDVYFENSDELSNVVVIMLQNKDLE